MYYKFFGYITTAALILLLSGCLDMDIENPNAPDAEQALNTPGDVESLLSDQYFQWWSGTQMSYPGFAMAVMGQELTSSWGNFGKFDLGRQPREPFINTPTYDYRGMVETPWSNLYAAINSSIEVLHQIEDPDFDLGDEGGEYRMEMFAKFIKGLSYASLANQFDQTILVDSDDELTDDDGQPVVIEPPGQPNYEEALAFSFDRLDEAEQIAMENPGVEIPKDWFLIDSSEKFSMDDFIAIINSYRARFKTSNPRTPDERDALDWEQIITYAENGYDEDLVMEADGNYLWSFSSWVYNDPGWHRVNYELIGRKDQSGNFEDWLNTPIPERTEFVLDTPDERIVDTEEDLDAGESGYVEYAGPAPHSNDRGTYFHSMYYTGRNWDTYAAGEVGPIPHMYRTEIDMYLAEGLLRTDGDRSRVAELINQTRVDNGGLDPVDADDSYDELFNAMRYEFEMETLGSAGGLAYYNKRGWGNLKGRDYGGLPEGTPLHFPIPAEELEGVLQMDPYTFGGRDDDEWGAGAQSGNHAPGINVDRIIEAMQAGQKSGEPEKI